MVIIQVYNEEDVTCVKFEVNRSDGKGKPVYLFLVDGMLIDTGPSNLEKEIISFYKKNSFHLVALTHSHEDHSGTASWIQENQNVPIYVHSKGIKICKQRSPYPEYRQVTWGARKEFDPLPLGDSLSSLNYNWDVIYTPGHAEDHVSFINAEKGQLFSGDLFVALKTKVIMNTESIPDIMNSISRLLTYDFKSMFCSHAGYIKDGKTMLKRKLAHLEYLYGEVERLYHIGYTLSEINRNLFLKNFPIVKVSNGEWDSTHIVSSIITDIEGRVSNR